MLLNELLRGVGKWNWNLKQKKYVKGEFDVSGHKYEVTLSYLEKIDIEEEFNSLPDFNPELQKTWDVEFFHRDETGDAVFGQTGTGNSAAVIGTVISMLKEFTKSHNVDSYMFSAKGASRQRLYEAIIKRLGSKVIIKNLSESKAYLVTL